MNGAAILLLVIGLGVIAWVSARAKAVRLRSGGTRRLHSLPNYHGWYVALWTTLPALLFLTVWSNVSPGLVTQAVLDNPAATELPEDAFSRGAILSEARNIATGEQANAFNPLAQKFVPLYEEAQSRYSSAGVFLALMLAFAGGAYAFTRVRPDFRARTRV
ncbi:MAG TPA: phosphate ABC transporter permease family protein, partial [Rhizorhapis sp.]|nr:phosphate ABC transporter permease family protein [Rhizorhapis sp.]